MTRSGPAVSKRLPRWFTSAPWMCLSFTIGLSPSLTEKRKVYPVCFLAFPYREYWMLVKAPNILPNGLDLIRVRDGPLPSHFWWNSLAPNPSLEPLYIRSIYLFSPRIIDNSICFCMCCRIFVSSTLRSIRLRSEVGGPLLKLFSSFTALGSSMYPVNILEAFSKASWISSPV